MAWRPLRVLVGAILVAGLGLLTAPPAHAVNLPQVPVVQGNPNPGTDLFASTIAVGTGGTERICATSPLGIPVHCVEPLNIQPSLPPTADGTTYAHWVFCHVACTPGLLRHEMVHVGQFEQYGDLFGPMY